MKIINETMRTAKSIQRDQIAKSKKYNTKLSPQEEIEFQSWLSNKYGYSLTNEELEQETYDYDMRGYWADIVKFGEEEGSENGHYPDTYKKPNHPTFSNESKYNDKNQSAGEWTQSENQRWGFKPSKRNLDLYDIDELMQYFEENEPDSDLLY